MGEDYRLHSGLLELIAGIALLDLEGGSGIGVRPEHHEDRLKKKNLTKGIKATSEEDQVSFQLEIHVNYGRDFLVVAGQAQQLVKEAVEAMTDLRVREINVHVVGVNAS